MKPNGVEKKLLEELSDSLVLRKSEIMKILSDSKMKVGDINVITKNLIQKGYIAEVYASEKTYAITQKGMKNA